MVCECVSVCDFEYMSTIVMGVVVSCVDGEKRLQSRINI